MKRGACLVVSLFLFPVYYLIFQAVFVTTAIIVFFLSSFQVSFYDIENFLNDHSYIKVSLVLFGLCAPAGISYLTYQKLLKTYCKRDRANIERGD